jgi:ABC-2 type transport system ATP-binding protein
LPGLIKAEEKENHIHLHFPPGTANLESINQFCFENEIVLSLLQMKKKSLETKFMELTS